MAIDDEHYSTGRARKRSRTVSSSSRSSSVSTISTNASRSPPAPPRSSQRQDGAFLANRITGRKRERSMSKSSAGAPSLVSKTHEHQTQDRNTRRRRTYISPDDRGRRRSRSKSQVEQRSSRARSTSVDHGHVTRNRRNKSPVLHSDNRERSAYGERSGPANVRNSPLSQHDEYAPEVASASKPSSKKFPQQRQGRSASPFSKRLALTQAMSRGI